MDKKKIEHRKVFHMSSLLWSISLLSMFHRPEPATQSYLHLSEAGTCPPQSGMHMMVVKSTTEKSEGYWETCQWQPWDP